MAKLTPLDIESKAFARGAFGFSTHEVKQFMREVLVNYESLYKENIELKDKVNMLNEGIQYYKTIEDTLQNTLILAEKTAEETKSTARKKAEQIEKEAEIKAQDIINTAKKEVYRINQKKEEMIKQYDASKIQMKLFLQAQLEMTEKNELELQQSLAMDYKSLEDQKTTNQDMNILEDTDTTEE